MKESDKFFKQGMRMLQLGDYKKAEENFKKARDIAKKDLLGL